MKIIIKELLILLLIIINVILFLELIRIKFTEYELNRIQKQQYESNIGSENDRHNYIYIGRTR